MMDSANQDTVRSIAELITPDDEDDVDHSSNIQIDVEKELTRRGFPVLNRLDSQAPDSLCAKSKKTGVCTSYYFYMLWFIEIITTFISNPYS